METGSRDGDTGMSRSCPGMIGLLSLRGVLGVVGVIVATIVSLLFVPSPLRSSGLYGWILLCFVILMSIFAGTDLLTDRLLGKRLKLPLVLRCIGCFSIVLIPTLSCTICSLNRAISARPSMLPQRAATSFRCYDSKAGITMGADLYFDQRLEPFDAYPNHGIAELILVNDTQNSIEIVPADIVLFAGKQPIEVVGYEKAQELVTWYYADAVVGPALQFEMALLSPLVLVSACEAYVKTKQIQAFLRDNEFEYGQIAPSQTHHGFVYFFERERRVPIYLSGRELGVTVHHSSGETSQYSCKLGE